MPTATKVERAVPYEVLTSIRSYYSLITWS